MRLIIWDDNWSDEFDIFGFEIITEKRYREITDALTAAIADDKNLEREYCFGSNECMYYSYSQIRVILFNSKIIELNEYEVITDIFGNCAGQTFLDSIEENLIDGGYLNG